MIQFFLNSMRRGKARRSDTRNQPWLNDPLAHPDLDRMTPAELADLPLGGVRFSREA